MVSRKKRLEKGIESIDRQIEFHKQKINESKNRGNIELEDYYSREIEGLQKTKERKQKQLEKE